MASSNKLRPEFVAFISGIAKYIDATDRKKSEDTKKESKNNETSD